jgi:zinc finger protein
MFKSDTASLSIPEIDLVLHPGTLGGRFTTVEGLLTQVYEELDTKVFIRGDSSQSEEQSAMSTFLGQLKQVN